ncbi:hypothetical protein T02_8715, partial [Trichinella nativa]
MLLKLSKVVLIFHLINLSLSQPSTCRNNDGNVPAQATGKIIHAGAIQSWENSPRPLTDNQGHSFAKTLENVVQTHGSIKFLAYNNVPPGIPNIKTKSNSKGVIIISSAANSAAAWFLTASLLLVQPVIHYNDIPETETAGMPHFKKLAEGQTPIIPPFRSRHTIRTQNAGAPVTVHIYSKSESSKYEIYKKVIVKALKKTIKVWSRNDK